MYSIEPGKWSKVKFFLIVNFCPVLLIILFNHIFLFTAFFISSIVSPMFILQILPYSHQNSFSAPSIHAHSLITCLLLLLEPLLMLMHLSTWDVLLPFICYLYLILYLEL